jgi:hypothetical protein
MIWMIGGRSFSEVGNRKVNHGKLILMHGFRGKYTILAHLLDMSQEFKVKSVEFRVEMRDRQNSELFIHNSQLLTLNWTCHPLVIS